MRYIEALQSYDGNEMNLFLAGGITGCPDWQQEMVARLQETSLVLFNPRRASFPIENAKAAMEQIEWEYIHLRKATAISFWFPCETLNPVVLYELGAWSMTNKPLFVGVHPQYQRITDVCIQTAFARPEVSVVMSLEALAQQIVSWEKQSRPT